MEWSFISSQFVIEYRRTSENRITFGSECTRGSTGAHRLQSERSATSQSHVVQGWPIDRTKSQQVPVRVFQVRSYCSLSQANDWIFLHSPHNAHCIFNRKRSELIIRSAMRNDSGQYECRVKNKVARQTVSRFTWVDVTSKNNAEVFREYQTRHTYIVVFQAIPGRDDERVTCSKRNMFHHLLMIRTNVNCIGQSLVSWGSVTHFAYCTSMCDVSYYLVVGRMAREHVESKFAQIECAWKR